MTVELKPCPFCGSENVNVIQCDESYSVLCYSCCAETDGYSTVEKAAKAWNRRAEASEPCRHPEAGRHDQPQHYDGDGIVTCADAMRSMMHLVTLSPMAMWWWGCSFKYMWRWVWKNGVKDLMKARDCLDRLIGEVGGDDDK